MGVKKTKAKLTVVPVVQYQVTFINPDGKYVPHYGYTGDYEPAMRLAGEVMEKFGGEFGLTLKSPLPPAKVSLGSITLTGAQIAELAEFVGAGTIELGEIEAETEVTICDCPAGGLGDEEGGPVSHYDYVAYLTEYPEEGMLGLGDPIKEC